MITGSTEGLLLEASIQKRRKLWKHYRTQRKGISAAGTAYIRNGNHRFSKADDTRTVDQLQCCASHVMGCIEVQLMQLPLLGTHFSQHCSMINVFLFGSNQMSHVHWDARAEALCKKPTSQTCHISVLFCIS
jgi:hypothetical protein